MTFFYLFITKRFNSSLKSTALFWYSCNRFLLLVLTVTSKWTVSSGLNQRHLKASSSLIHLKTQWLTFPNKEPNKKTILQSAWSCANIITTNVGLKINGFWTKSLAGRKGGVFVIKKKKLKYNFFFFFFWFLSGLQTTVINVGSETWSRLTLVSVTTLMC